MVTERPAFISRSFSSGHVCVSNSVVSCLTGSKIRSARARAATLDRELTVKLLYCFDIGPFSILQEVDGAPLGVVLATNTKSVSRWEIMKREMTSSEH